MIVRARASALLACAVFVAAVSARARLSGADGVADVREEALRRSRAMEWVRALTTGPRLTGSPGLDAAGAWAEQQLKELGLANVRVERWPFERRWSVTSAALEIVQPDPLESKKITFIPQTWSPGTPGAVTGPLRILRLNAKAEFLSHADRVRGAFVLVQTSGTIAVDVENRFQRFLEAQHVLATLERSSGSHSDVVYVRTGHTPDQDGRELLVPSLSVRPDDFKRLERLAEKNAEVILRADIAVVVEAGGSERGFNVTADVPGRERPDELVVIGAHLDSIHAAQGATDNAAGCAIVIEAARAILAASEPPRRTIRVALWGGEEQGRRGSKAYVQAHARDRTTAYFNVDRGGGRINGLLVEGDNRRAREAAAWARRLSADRAGAIQSMTTAGSDHISFRDAGVPTFTFMHDMLSYRRTHHSTADVMDEVREADLRQASAVVAVAAYLAAR